MWNPYGRDPKNPKNPKKRALGFFQRPRPSPWSSCPGSTVCSVLFRRKLSPLQTRTSKVTFTNQDVSHLSLQQVSQVSVQELFNHSMTSPTRVFSGSSFMCVVCGFRLLVKVWIAFIVLALGVLGLLRWLFLMISVTPPYPFVSFA